MSISSSTKTGVFSDLGRFFTKGMAWFLISVVAAVFFFKEGFDALLKAWQLPEYSHGPLIPVLSLLLFLRQLKDYPVNLGEINDRWVGVGFLMVAIAFGMLGKLAKIDDIVAYALILWVGAILLISFGWKTGKYFWPPVLHLVYMLPLPDTLYYKLSIYLQFISSELGVFFLQALGVSVLLEGNIIDLGLLKLHVAEACSGLRYLFPILSFSYIFAVLYQGPMWHKAILLISAAPITVLMNSVRIAVAGVIVNSYGVEWLEGFTHFFEGWVIFTVCVLILFLLAWILVAFRQDDETLLGALDLETEGLGEQASRIAYIQPSKALIAGTVMLVAVAIPTELVSFRNQTEFDREPFALFPNQIGEWGALGPPTKLKPAVEANLAADDYISLDFSKDPSDVKGRVDFFVAWYKDQTKGGTHSPEICLPGSGWEISELNEVDISSRIGVAEEFEVNLAIIQKGELRMMVYYWFEQRGTRIANDLSAKLALLKDSVLHGRTDGALMRLTTVIAPNEPLEDAQLRLDDLLVNALEIMPDYIPK